jgi:esterase
MAEDLRAFMEARWMFSASIVGHSMGGKAAMQLALSHPDMVERLVVVDMDPGQSVDHHKQVFKALLGIDFSKIRTRQDAEDFMSNHISDVGTRQFLLKNITREADGSFSWKMNLPVLWSHYGEVLAPISGDPFDKPTLFIRGGKSDYIQDSDWPLIKSLFPQAELVTIEGAGHWVHADKPKELIAVLEQFLKK